MVRLPCRQRIDAEELVDHPDLSMDEIRATVHDQSRVNRWLGGAHATLVHALPVLRASASIPIRVLEVACGGADLSRLLVDEARKLEKVISVTAIDMNRKIIATARELSQAYPEISFVVADALCLPFQQCQFDMVIMPTFLHHLQPEQVIRLLQAAKKICRGTVIVADLVRSPLALLGFRIFSRLAHFTPVSIHDGEISVCRAYTLSELADFADRAGLEQWSIIRHRINRMTLVYRGG